ncbi:MAG: hypothetical protein H6813_05755 [Phycisphaeraceae bacterium]|nr:hypothetical protein [Phycisphaeraceae bacterium]MCB9847973.1 hypothetical protein [Phycisphaeraceae bacterium]
MTLRTDRFSSNVEADRDSHPGHPIAFNHRPSLGERIIAAARVAAAMHLTGAALIAADEAALAALDARDAARDSSRNTDRETAP